MKLRKVRISGWTILIPSLVLNIGLLAAAAYFLNQLDFHYQQASTTGGFVHTTSKQSVPSTSTPQVAVRLEHTAADGGN